MNVLLAPDVYVNASVALGTPPEQVVQRVLGRKPGQAVCSEWILERVAAMLGAVPEFKKEAIDHQVGVIRGLVSLVKTDGKFDAGAWQDALIAAAKAAKVDRVITDHPDLLAAEGTQGIEFVSTETWLFEQTMPPPAPPPGAKKKA